MSFKRKEDIIIENLKELFDSNGYKYYKMRKFEEYSLYMENKNFLSSDYIITFNHNGKLLALKPDVTLSIVKNAKIQKGKTQKLYYRENVYRYDRKSHDYKEINQLGLEVVGKIDFTHDCEILNLALMSLDIISKDSRLCISNTGVIAGLLSHLNISSDYYKNRIINSIREKSRHELYAILDELSIDSEGKELFNSLFEGKIPVVEETKEAYESLTKTVEVMKSLGWGDKINIDFSIINDLDYYNGTVFNGYVSNVPRAVLSGGRYDGLVEKFGTKVNAEGFAVYLDDILYLDEKIDYDADVLLIYSEDADPSKVLSRSQEIRERGESVYIATAIPDGFKFKRKENL